jgi:CheY-like chemotaxis protein/nitrogen-specific signal transduction histidine kinase
MEQIKDKIERVLSKLVNPPNNTKKIFITPINSIKHLPDINADNQRYEYIMFQKSFDKIIRRDACKTVPSVEETATKNLTDNMNDTNNYRVLTCNNDNNGCGIRTEEYANNSLDFNVYLKMFIHELRTPISTISMGLDLIKLDSSASKNNHNVQTIRTLKKSIQFIEDIFSKFSVIQEGNIELNTFIPFSLNALLLNVTHLLKYHLQESDVFFQYSIHPDVYDWIYGDIYNLKHCIINLLKNAIKYNCPHRSSVITIDIYKTIQPETIIPIVVEEENQEMVPHPPTVSKRNSDSFRKTSLRQSRKTVIKKKQPITISIKDNNDPILPHIKERLFESFNSTSGSGLGLYICKNIIELHGGNINHTFIEPEGNEFFINLNVELCEDSGLQISNNHNNSKETSDNSKETSDNSKETSDNSNDNSGERISEKSSISIIIIDDSLLNRKLLYKLLKNVNKKFTIYTAVNGKDTIKRKEFIINHIRIIFLDKYMPLMNGIEVTKELRDSGYKQLIIGLTGEDNNTTNQIFLESGADIVFIKPLDISKINMINEFIITHGTNRQENKSIQIVDNQLKWV